MSRIVELQLAPQALAIISVPIDKHINLFYTGLAIIFTCVMAYMFFSKKRQ
ncbi:hypothetical protein [Edaphobacter bradus]|uniref:hypothetical protein n=1 Tax=Edaphobacter bradus TaxID=2259016 RepID=UPI0021DFC3F2|nr:hypothetical protein [Edaphobacter bradus]